VLGALAGFLLYARSGPKWIGTLVHMKLRAAARPQGCFCLWEASWSSLGWKPPGPPSADRQFLRPRFVLGSEHERGRCVSAAAWRSRRSCSRPRRRGGFVVLVEAQTDHDRQMQRGCARSFACQPLVAVWP
jgi:hypothetical protein